MRMRYIIKTEKTPPTASKSPKYALKKTFFALFFGENMPFSKTIFYIDNQFFKLTYLYFITEKKGEMWGFLSLLFLGGWGRFGRDLGENIKKLGISCNNKLGK